MKLGRRRAVALFVVAVAALLGSHAAVGVVGALLVIAILQLAVLVVLLDSRAARLRQREASETATRALQDVKHITSRMDRALEGLSGDLAEGSDRLDQRLTVLKSDLIRDVSGNVATQLVSERREPGKPVLDVETQDSTELRTAFEQVRGSLDELGERCDRQYVLVESLLALYHDLSPVEALPPLRRWTASPDLLHYLYRRIRADEPGEILELGSGISTVVMAYALRAVARGRIVALEHDEQYLGETAALLGRHGLGEWVDLRLAPLEAVEVDGDSFEWYATSALPDGPVDLVLVDGPPGSTGPRARYPALPLLHARLAAKAVVVLDDLNRRDERSIAAAWRDAYPDLVFERLSEHEKGTGVFMRR